MNAATINTYKRYKVGRFIKMLFGIKLNYNDE